MLKRALRAVLRRARERSARRERAKLERQLTATPGYDYTCDWVTGHLDSWKRLFGALADRPVQLLEIGSYEGRSTVWFLANILRHPGSTIACIDLFDDPLFDLRFDHNIRVSQCTAKVRKLQGRSADRLLELRGEHFDLIYVDGAHPAADVLLDAVLSWPLLKPGGILLFDDYGWEPEKPASERPQLAIDLFLESKQGQFELLRKNYQVALRRLG